MRPIRDVHERSCSSVGGCRRLAALVAGMYWVGLAILTHLPNMHLIPPAAEPTVWQLDKAGHVVLFGLLALLLARALPGGGRGAALLAVVVAAAYVPLDEYTQQWAAEREFSLADMVAGWIGIVGVYVVLATESRGCDSRGWVTTAARFCWIVVTPALLLLATLPAADPIVARLFSSIRPTGIRVDKVAHFVVAIVLTWLLAAGRPAGRSRPRLGALLTVVIMGVSAPVVEVVQRYTGRGFEVADVFAHELGLLAALVGWALWLAVWRSWGRAERVGQGLGG